MPYAEHNFYLFATGLWLVVPIVVLIGVSLLITILFIRTNKREKTPEIIASATAARHGFGSTRLSPTYDLYNAEGNFILHWIVQEDGPLPPHVRVEVPENFGKILETAANAPGAQFVAGAFLGWLMGHRHHGNN